MTLADYCRRTDYPNGRTVIRHRSGLTATMDRRTGEYIHGVRPVYDGWMATLRWMDDMDDTTDDDTGSSWPPLIS